MGSIGIGGTLSSASDVAFSNPAQDDLMVRSGGYWSNLTLTGRAALANKGGAESVATNASASGAVALDLNNGNVFNLTLTGNVTSLTISNSTSGRACGCTLYLRQDGAGGRTVAWPTGTRWSGGAPTLTTTGNAVDIVVLETIDGGTTWYGSLVGTNFV